MIDHIKTQDECKFLSLIEEAEKYHCDVCLPCYISLSTVKYILLCFFPFFKINIEHVKNIDNLEEEFQFWGRGVASGQSKF